MQHIHTIRIEKENSKLEIKIKKSTLAFIVYSAQRGEVKAALA